MIQKLAVNNLVYTTARSFEDVVKACETVVDALEDIGWASIPSAAKDVADFEARVHTKIGSSGFTRFLALDHGDWLNFFSKGSKARQHVIGNPLIAITMLRHDIRVGAERAGAGLHLSRRGQRNDAVRVRSALNSDARARQQGRHRRRREARCQACCIG